MRILFVTLFLPREKAYHAGGRYVYEVIRGLSSRHEIHLATRLEEDEIPFLEALRPLCRAVYPYTYRTGQKRGPADIVRLILNYIGFSRFADTLAAGGGFDIVQVEWTEAGMLMKRRGVPMVLDAHDVISKPARRRMLSAHGLKRGILFLRYAMVRALEKTIVRKFDTVFTLSEYDRNYLLDMCPGLDVSVVPAPAGMDLTDKKYERSENTILFLASYRYRRTNVEAALYFCREVFPLIREKIPAARFIAAGYGPPGDLKALEYKDPQISVPGFVDDLDECHKRAAVFAAPILVGGGIIVKVLDAMAAGTPVVTTTYGNEGIGAVPGRDLLVADDAEAFAAAVIRVLSDREFGKRLGDSGRDFVRKHYSLEAVMNGREAAYAALSGCRKMTDREQ